MNFLSLPFLVALGLGVLVFHHLPPAARSPYLLLASYCFYATWSLPWTGLLIGATAFVFFAARRAVPSETPSPSKRSSIWLWGAILVLVLVLFFLKYLPPFSGGTALSSVVAPIGISYYTFRLISYIVDVHWGKLKPESDFVAFALSIAFFPQIVSGPIHRPIDLLPQLKRTGPVSRETVRNGLRLILFGAFEKLVVADRLKTVVDNIFNNLTDYPGPALALGAYAFALQLFADFSGLTDIALGMGRLFGIEGPENFDQPFLSTNMQAFWRRWHMSLTSWLNDYLFLPLRMLFRRAGTLGLIAAIFVDMFAIGVWHGPKWTFLAFGAVNGVLVSASALTLKARNSFFKRHPRLSTLRAWVAPLITFHLVVIAFVFFRANSLADAAYVLAHLGSPSPQGSWGLKGVGLVDQLGVVGLVGVPLILIVQRARASDALRQAFQFGPRWRRWVLYYVVLLAIVAFGQMEKTTFIYEQF
jgi:alginate O-acetyltransferase complex protein AlgI